jgi:anti-sigma factor RsiW
MSLQHLSDEAVAAFADGVLRGHARDRASRHTAACAECAQAVRVQREAVLVLRAAPAPQLPVGLADRLRALPATTPINSTATNAVPAAIASDGSALFAAFGTMASAALVPPVEAAPIVGPTEAEAVRWRPTRRMTPLLLTAAAVAATGVFAVASSSLAAAPSGPVNPELARVVPVGADGPAEFLDFHRP